MTPTDSRADLAIIGSGSAAFAAAIAATNLGKRVVMVERGTVGGTCVNVGCVPSKALLAAAEARHTAAAAGRFPGLTAATVPVDFADLIAGKDALVEHLRTDKYVDLATDYGWEIVSGTAVFDGAPATPALRVELTGGGTRVIEADHYLIATGASPSVPPVAGLAEAGYLTSTTAMDLTTLPESLIVLGAGYVGLEQAQLFARLGSTVTVIARTRLTSGEEPEISAALEAVFTDEHIDVHTATTVEKVLAVDGHKVMTVRTPGGNSTELRAEHVLIATGRRPNTAGLGLESVGVTVDADGAVVIDDHQASSNPRIWAAGDVTGDPQFVYVAAAQGTLVADNALTGADRTLDYTTVPRVTFTSPAIASVGLTDAQAAQAGLACQCRVLDLAYVPRALVNRDTRGLVKIIAEQGTGRILGVHALTDNAGDLITAAGYAMTAGLTVHQLAHTWAPYLTMGEALKLTAQTFTTDVTKLSCCAG
ncbi:mercury(II) reductase [Rhodococcus qingshengii]|nr:MULTISPECIES: mercury(II) reductase [Rhodococcus]MDV8128870.1 mercury(II) reductase [Rhodococcus sp. IEGM 1304]